jgi:hypothetical protein
MYVDRMNLRKIARRLKVHHRTIAFWVLDRAVRDAEMDEPFTCISEKKTGISIRTIVDRHTRCLLGWAVVWECTQAAIQQLINEAPKAK